MNVDELGVTERLAVDAFVKVTEDGLKVAKDYVAEFEKLVEIDWEAIIRDSQKKNLMVPQLPHLEKLVQNLSMGLIMPTLIAIMTKDKDENDAAG